MEKLDYKKEYKDLYLPKTKPMLIQVPNMKFIMIKGKGNPNSESGEYQEALSLLYALSFTIKMSKLGENQIKGYFEYVVPPLEGLWWNEGNKTVDYQQKEKFDLVVSNPPYIKKDVIEKLDKEVKKEPYIALNGGQDGLYFYKKIVNEVYKYLKHEGYLCFEIGFDQKEDVTKIIEKEEKFKNIYSKKDLCEMDRIIVAQLK